MNNNAKYEEWDSFSLFIRFIGRTQNFRDKNIFQEKAFLSTSLDIKLSIQL